MRRSRSAADRGSPARRRGGRRRGRDGRTAACTGAAPDMSPSPVHRVRIIQCEPGTDPVAILQAPQLARLPFGQLLVIIPDRLAKRRERPYHERLGLDDPVKMGAIGFLAGEDGLARGREAFGLLPPVRVGRNPGQLDFLIRRNVLERGACIPYAVPLRLDSSRYACGSRDSAGDSQGPGSGALVTWQGYPGCPSIPGCAG